MWPVRKLTQIENDCFFLFFFSFAAILIKISLDEQSSVPASSVGGCLMLSAPSSSDQFNDISENHQTTI